MVEAAKVMPFLCRKKGCSEVATHVPVVRFWDIGAEHTAGAVREIGLGVKLCERHATAATADTLYTEDGWAEIVAEAAKRKFGEPDRSTVEVIADPICFV